MDFKELGFSEELSGQRVVIEVSADVNDGDYIRGSQELDADELLEVLPIVKKVGAYTGNHNWESRTDYLSEEEIEIIDEYVPYLDNEEVHSIEISITAYDGKCYKL